MQDLYLLASFDKKIFYENHAEQKLLDHWSKELIGNILNEKKDEKERKNPIQRRDRSTTVIGQLNK
ncbi:hypothetical protein T06_13572 [Trichinella sp. T6]|nr:hypothetical protein T06_13572 [Trichinella sp. T6]